MFEEEVEERAKDIYTNFFDDVVTYPEVLKAIWVGVQKGTEFGYNKANEWHYVKDGDVPKDTTSLYLVRVYSWDFGLSHLYKKYGMYIPIVCEWKGEYFSALDEMAYSNARNIKNCIAWKEIALPELKESEFKSEMFPKITLPKGSSEFIDKVIADAEKRVKERE